MLPAHLPVLLAKNRSEAIIIVVAARVKAFALRLAKAEDDCRVARY